MYECIYVMCLCVCMYVYVCKNLSLCACMYVCQCLHVHHRRPRRRPSVSAWPRPWQTAKLLWSRRRSSCTSRRERAASSFGNAVFLFCSVCTVYTCMYVHMWSCIYFGVLWMSVCMYVCTDDRNLYRTIMKCMDVCTCILYVRINILWSLRIRHTSSTWFKP